MTDEWLQLVSKIIRAHSFPWATEFRAEPWNLHVAMEFPHFSGILWNLIKRPVINSIANVTM